MAQRKKLREQLGGKAGFVVVAELVGGPNFDFTPISKFLSAYKKAGAGAIPAGFNFAGITLPQNPGGTPNIEPVYAIEKLLAEGLLDDLDCIPHISCKDHNANAIVNSLVGLRDLHIETILGLTGDKPVAAKRVFDLDSIGLLQLVRDMNNESYIKARPQDLDKVHQFFPGAAVSPFKYTEASLMQQYYKMEKKIACGAEFLITQVGWDWKKSQELFRYLADNNIDIPVIGNVYVLSTTTAAPRLMHDVKLTGCFVSDGLLAKLYSENVSQHIERAAQQVAMYKAMGAAGVDIGGIHDFDAFASILKRASEIGGKWEQFKDNLCWPAKNAFYLYDEAGNRAKLSIPRKTFKHKFFNFFHRAILNPDYHGFHVFKKVMAVMGDGERERRCLQVVQRAKEGASSIWYSTARAAATATCPKTSGFARSGGAKKVWITPPAATLRPRANAATTSNVFVSANSSIRQRQPRTEALRSCAKQSTSRESRRLSIPRRS